MIKVFQIGCVVLVCACCVGLAVLLVGPSRYYCPQPSSRSVAALFAPCQAFDTSFGHAITEDQAVKMGLLTPSGNDEKAFAGRGAATE